MFILPCGIHGRGPGKQINIKSKARRRKQLSGIADAPRGGGGVWREDFEIRLSLMSKNTSNELRITLVFHELVGEFSVLTQRQEEGFRADV